MRVSRFGRRALCVTSRALLAALLCACSTHGSSGVIPGLSAPGDVSSLKNTQRFNYTGHRQTFEVPAGVTAIKLVADGASGGGSTGGYGSESAGGAGGSVQATIPVTPGEKLAVFVGGEGATDGGFNGGGDGGSTTGSGGDGGGGGGASDVRQGGDALANRVVVAGGGAVAERKVRALREAGTMNPVIVLDEVDKLGSDYRGDPSSALLEVLDPAQNHTFRDHYLEVELDLSKVLFIATANMVDTIPAPLLDRMEVIRLDGYTEDEKVAIARHHLVGRQLERAALASDEVVMTDDALRSIVGD